MNNRKLAVFVEGQTELVFVREFLKQWYGYDVNVVGFDCYNLLSKEFCDAEYKYGSEDSENYFMIATLPLWRLRHGLWVWMVLWRDWMGV